METRLVEFIHWWPDLHVTCDSLSVRLILSTWASLLLECSVLTLLVPIAEVCLTLIDLVVLLKPLTVVRLARVRALLSSIIALPVIRVRKIILFTSLVGKDAIEFDVAIVHHKILRHESFQLVSIDDIESTVVLQAAHQVLNALFKGLPVFLVLLHLQLRVR